MVSPGTVARPTLQELARSGELVTFGRCAPPEVASDLHAEAYAFMYPLVFERHTRRLERLKNHGRCAISFQHLEPECCDGFQDDVLAMIDYTFRYAKEPITNLEGWAVSRLPTGTVDGYRRRRGEIGALQRPRVPQWLIRQLTADPWRVELARHILEWVGVPATASYDTWPTERWAEFRATRTGDWASSTPGVVETEVREILAQMRAARPLWYQQYIERPLGAKQPPVCPVDRDIERDGSLDDVIDRADRELTDLAELAIEQLAESLAAGGQADVIVPEVVQSVFRPAKQTVSDNCLSTALSDPVVVRRVIDVVLGVLAGRCGD